MHIYKITNLVNNKVYIGQTIQKNPKMRWYDHCAYARSGKKSYLYDSIRKHGVDNFRWEIIDAADSINELNDKEKYWLDYYRNVGIVYNNREAGNNKTHSEASIEKMRQVHKLRHATTNIGGWKRIDGGPMKGKSHSTETKEKMRQAAIKREAQKRESRIGV